MDEVSKQKEPTENGESPPADPDIISLPRRAIGTPQVVAIFIFLLALVCLSGVAMLLNETVILADIVEKGYDSEYVNSMLDIPGSEEAKTRLYALYGAAVCLCISAFGLVFGAIALAFFLGAGKTWTWVNVLLFPLTVSLFGICLVLGMPTEREKIDFIAPVALMLLPALVVAIILRRVVEWIAPVRDDSEQGRDRLSRSSISKACVAILVFYSLFFVGVGLGFADNITWRIGFANSSFMYWIISLVPLTIPVLVMVLFGLKRGRIAVIIAMMVITGLISFVFISGYYSKLASFLRIPYGVPDLELYRIITGFAIAGFTGITLLYPLYVLTILPFRPLGKELFRRVEK